MTIYTDATVRLVAEFRTFDAILCDPTTITVRHMDPASTVVTSVYSPGAASWGHPNTGVFTFDLVVALAGIWQFSFEGTGAVDTYGESRWLVHQRSF